MSRRTKLLITALFLVLLGIPVVHVAWHWIPAQPLQFRYVPPAPGAVPWSRSLGTTTAECVVENHSSTTVYLWEYWLLREPPPDNSIEGMFKMELAEKSLENYRLHPVRIPAHSSARIILDLSPEDRVLVEQGRGWLGYAFHSAPKATLTRAILWSPASWRPHFPMPRLDRSTAPIQTSPAPTAR